MQKYFIFRSGSNSANQTGEQLVCLSSLPLNFEGKDEVVEWAKKEYTCYNNQQIYCRTEEEMTTYERLLSGTPRPLPEEGNLYEVYRHGANKANQPGQQVMLLDTIRAESVEEAETFIRERYDVFNNQYLEVKEVEEYEEELEELPF